MGWFSRKPKNEVLSARDCGIGSNAFNFEIVGESSYQDALRRARTSAKKEDGRGRAVVTVVLRREPSNRYDANAIAVVQPEYGCIGYVPRDTALVLRPYFQSLEQAGLGGAVCEAVLVGGDGTRSSIGAYLNFRPVNEDDSLWQSQPDSPRTPQRGEPTGFRSGLSSAQATDHEDDSYDLGWMDSLTGSPASDIPLVRRLLRAEAEHIARHYLFGELERLLYRSRDAFGSALEEFDAICREHDAEMDQIRRALVAKWGFVPLLETYKQAAIRHQKAGNFDQVVRWAQRGIDLYGDLAFKPEWPQDLMKRRDNATAKLQKASAKVK